MARGERHKIVVPLGIARRGEGDGSHGASSEGVRGVVILKQLHIRAQLKAHAIKIRGPHSSDNGGGAHGVGNTVLPRKLIQASDGVGYHVANHEAGKALERKAVRTCSKTLFNSTNRPLDLANVAVGWDNVKRDGKELDAGTFQLVVAVHIANGEAACCVLAENVL